MINNQKFSHCIKYQVTRVEQPPLIPSMYPFICYTSNVQFPPYTQDSFCDVAFTSNNFDLGAGDSITLGDNKQTGMNFGTGGMLQCKLEQEKNLEVDQCQGIFV